MNNVPTTSNHTSPKSNRTSPTSRNHTFPTSNSKDLTSCNHTFPTSNHKAPTSRNHTFPTSNHKAPTSRNHMFPTSNHKAPNTEAARFDYRAPAAVDGASGRFHLLILIRNWSITSAVKRYYVNGIGLKVVFDSCFLPRCRSPSCFALQDISIFIRNHSMSHYCLQ